MGSKYWVGGSGNWNDINHWSTSSGGPSGIETLGAESVVNGNFATDTVWVKGVGCVISGGTLYNVNGTYTSQANVFTIGKAYKITFDISNFISNGQVSDTNGTTYMSISGNGSYSSTIVNGVGASPPYYYPTTQHLMITGTFAIDNISVKEILSIPTSTDDVFFDNLSFTGTSTVNINALANTLNMSWSGITQNVTLVNSSYNLNVYGSLILWTGLTWTFSNIGYFYMKATDNRTITTNNIIVGANRLYFDGVGGNWILMDNLSLINSRSYLVRGTLNTNNFNYSSDGIFDILAGTNTLNLSSSVLTCARFRNGNSTNFVFNAGTSTVVINSVSVNDEITGTNVFYNLTIQSINNVCVVSLDSNQYVTNLLTLSGYNSSDKRILITSNAIGTSKTITAPNVVASNVDFRDISVPQNLASNWNLSSITGGSGDCGGNLNITFTPSQTQYFKHTSGSVNWSDQTKWFTETNGGGVQGRVPLPQDDAIFDENSFSGISTIIANCLRIGGLNMSGVTQSVTFTPSQAIECYDSFIVGNNITLWGNLDRFLLMYSRNLSFLSLLGKPIRMVGFTCLGLCTVLSDIVVYEYLAHSYGGKVDFNDFNVTSPRISNNGGSGSSMWLGNGTITLFGNTTIDVNVFENPTNLYCEGSTIKLQTISNSFTQTFNGGNNIYNKLWISGTHTGYYNITGSNTFSEIKIDDGRKVRFTSSTTTTVGSLIAEGTSISGITITSITSGSTYTLVKSGTGTVTVNYCNISYSTASSSFRARNSIDSGGNTGWVFNTNNNLYWIGGSGNWTDPSHWSGTSGGPSGMTTEMITNDTDRNLDSDTGYWTKSAGVTISGGVAHFNNVGIYQGLFKNYILTTGKTYRIQYTVSNYVSGIASFQDGVVTILTSTSNGTYTTTYVPSGNIIGFGFSTAAGNSTYDIDNVSIKEVVSIPNSMNDAVFDQNSFSGTSTVTINSNADCFNLNFSGITQSVSLINSDYNLNVYGSLILWSGLTTNFTSTGYLYLKAQDPNYIISNNNIECYWNRVYFDGVGGSWDLIGNFNVGAFVNTFHRNGTLKIGANKFITGNYITDIGTKTLDGSGGGILELYRFNNAAVPGFTFIPGTLTINFPMYPNGSIAGGSITCYNLSISGGSNLYMFNLESNITINNTLTINGSNSTNYRLLFSSSVIGTPRIITCNGSIVSSNVDFRDIYLSGSTIFDLSGITGGSGDGGGNSGITFTPSQTQYFKHTSGAVNWSDSTKWFSDYSPREISGRVPLPQDDVIFDNNSFSGNSILTVDVPRMGRSLNMSTVNQLVTLNIPNVVECYGSHILGNNITPSYGNIVFPMGRNGYYDINTFEKTTSSFYINAPNGSYRFLSNITGGIIRIYNGTLDFNDYNVYASGFYFDGGVAYLGNGILTTYSNNSINVSSVYISTCIIYPENATIIVQPTDGSNNVRVSCINGLKKMIFAETPHTGNIIINSPLATINELIIEKGRKVNIPTSGILTLNKLTVLGTSTSGVTISSTVTGSTHTLLLTTGATVDVNYAKISYSTVSGSTILARNSTDSGGNSGWVFPGSFYWIGGSGNWSDRTHWSSTSGGPSGITYGRELIKNGGSVDQTDWIDSNSDGLADGFYNYDQSCINSIVTGNGFNGNAQRVVENNAINYSIFTQITSSIVSGKTYTISGKYRSSQNFNIHRNDGNFYNFTSPNLGPTNLGNALPFSFTFDSVSDFYYIATIGANSWFEVDELSIKEVYTTPTSMTNVIFDQNSFSGTSIVTIDTNVNCNTMDWTDINQSVTLQNSSYDLNVYGSLILQTGLTWNFTSTGYLYLKSTNSGNFITTNGAILNANKVNLDGSGGTWTNMDDLNLGSCWWVILKGSWFTNNKNITTTGEIHGISSEFRLIDLGSSTIVCNGWICTNWGGSNFTFNCGTSTIYALGNASMYTGGKTFYNVVLKGNVYIDGDGVFNNLSILEEVGYWSLYGVVFAGNITTNILTISSVNSTNKRVLASSVTLGAQKKIKSDVVIASNVDFRDIYLSGSTVFDLSDISGGSGDCGGNSGITFTPSQTQYFKHTSGSVNWGDSTKWFTSSGGIVQGRVPLPQDDVYFDENSFIAGSTLTVDVPRIGKTLHMLDVNKNISVYFNTNIECYGDVKISNYVLINDNIWKFNLMGNSVHIDIRTVFNMNLFLKPFSTFIFDNDYFSNKNMQNIVNWLPCSIDFNDKNITISNIYFIGIGPIYLRSGIFTLIGGEAWLYLSGIDGGTSTIIINNTNSLKVDMAILNKVIVNNTIDKNPISLNLLNTNSNGRVWINELIIYSGNTLKFDSMTETKYPYYLINKLTAMGTSNSGITITSVNSGSTHTLLLTSGCTVNYANISYSTVSGSTTTTRNSIDSGGNTNWIFPAKRYWIGGSGNWNDPSHWSSTSGGPSGTTSLGTNLIKNGGFDDGSYWDLYSNFNISGGTLNCNTSIINYAFQNINSVTGRTYFITFSITNYTSGIIGAQIGLDAFGFYSGIGTYTGYTTTTTWNTLYFASSAFVGSIDNVSIREVVNIPTDSSDVIFDQNSFSGTSTITINSDAYCNTMDWENINQNVILQNSAYNLNIYGSLILQTGLTINFTSIGYLYFKGTNLNNTITTNGNISSWNIVYFDGIGGGWINQDDWISSSIFYLINGTWYTNDKTISIGSIGFGIGTKTWNLGSSNIIISGNLFFHINGNGLTFNCGTSTISIFGSNGSGLYTNGETFYNVITNNISASGNPKFNSLTYPNINGYIGSFSIGEYGGTNITIYDTLNIQGISNSQRILVCSYILGLQKTIINNGNIVSSYVDFRDIYLSGSTIFNLSGITGGSGDCGGNSGITFTPPQTQYFKHTSGSVNWSNSTKWVTSSGGVMLGRVPLPQDTAIFDENSFSEISTLTIDVSRIGSLDMSLVDTGVTLLLLNNLETYGNFILGNNITLAGYQYIILCGRNNYSLNTYNKTLFGLSHNIGNYTNLSNITLTSNFYFGYCSASLAVFDLNDYDMIVSRFLRSTAFGATIYFGSGTTTLTYSGPDAFGADNNHILYFEKSTLKFIGSGNISFFYGTGGKTFYNIIISGLSNFSLAGNSNTYNEIKIEAGNTVKFTEGTTTTINSLIAEGTSDSGITITSVTSGSTHTLVKTGTGAINVKYATISYSNASTPNVFRTRRSTNLIGNTGWVFPPEKYWIGGSGNWDDLSHWSDTSGGSGITETLGPELVLNGNFTTTSNWTLTSNVSINTGLGVCQFVNATGVNGCYQSVFTLGRTYKCTIEIKNYVGGSIGMTDGNSVYGSYMSGNGNYSFIFSPISTTIYIMSSGSAATMDVDNISVKEILSMPNSGTTLYFDQNSFSSPSTVSLSSYGYCLDMDWSEINQNIIFSSTRHLNIYGSLILFTGLTWSFDNANNYLYFRSTQTSNFIKTNGVSFGGIAHPSYYIQFNGIGGSWCNLDDMSQSITGDIYLTNGTWNTNDKTITFNSYLAVSNNSTLILGNSTFNAGNGFGFSVGTSVNAGTSTFILSGDWGIGGGNTFYNVIINQASLNHGGTYGNFICKNLTRIGGNSNLNSTPLSGDIIVTDTLTLSGYSSGSARTLIQSNTIGTQRKITANNVVASNVDFRDVYLSGSTIWNLSGITGGSGDAGGNSGITFTPSQTQYWHVGTGNWSNPSKWFTQTNGVGTGRVPLPQDDMIFDENSFDTTGTITIDVWRLGRSLNMSNVTQSVSISASNNIDIYGDFILNPLVNIANTGYKDFYLMGRENYNLSTFNNSNNAFRYYLYPIGGKYTLQSDFFFPEYFYLYVGTLDLNDYNMTGGIFGYMTIAAGSTLYMGNGTLTIKRNYGGNAGFNNLGNIFCENSTVKYELNSSDGTFDVPFSGGGKKYNKLWISGTHTGNHIISGNNTFNEIKIDPGKTVKFEDNSSQTVSRLISLGKPNNLISISSVSSGFTHTLNNPPNDWLVDYVNFSSSLTYPEKNGGFNSSTTVLTGKTYGWDLNLISVNVGDSRWSFNGTVSISGYTAPDGSNTAYKLIDINNSWGYKGAYCRTPLLLNNTNPYTFSVFAKSAEYTKMFFCDPRYGRFSAIFDLSNGTVSSTLSGVAGVENIGGGWYRCYIVNNNGGADYFVPEVSAMPNSGSVYWIYDIQYTGTTNSGIYVWSPQVFDNTDYYSFGYDSNIRYWIGDSGNFNDPSHWSLQSNGLSGATIPTFNHTVIFDRYSFTHSGQTVTINSDISTSSLYMEDINQSGITISSNYNLTLYGSLYLASGMTFNVNNLYFKSSYNENAIYTKEVILNVNNIYFDNLNGVWKNYDNMTTTGNIHHINGVWNTNDRLIIIKNYLLEIGTKQLNLGNSTFNVQNFDIKTNSNNYTIIAGTSKIRSTGGITMLSQNLYDVETNNFDAISPTVNNLTLSGNTWVVAGNPIITETLQINGNSSTDRFLLKSDILRTQRTITAQNVIMSNVDIIDIKGNDWNLIGTNVGDGGGNTGITFTPSTTQYWYQGSGNWSDVSKWTSRVPLLQDIAVFDQNSFISTSTLNIDMSRISNINMSSVTQQVMANDMTLYGNVYLNNITLNNLYLYSRDVSYLNISGCTINNIFINGNYINRSNMKINSFTLIDGSFKLGNYVVEVNDFSVLSGNLNSDNSTIKLTPTGTTDITFNGGDKIYNNLWLSGDHSGYFNILGNNTFNEIKIDAGKKIKFESNSTQKISSLITFGTVDSGITISSTNTSQHNLILALNKSYLVFNYLDISYSNISPTNRFYAINSINNGNNTGWVFTSPPLYVWIQDNNGILIDDDGKILW